MRKLNDDEENLYQTGAFAAALPHLIRVDILPYHRIGADKYDRMGATYGLRDLLPPTSERIAEVASRLRSHGLIVDVGGS